MTATPVTPHPGLAPLLIREALVERLNSAEVIAKTLLLMRGPNSAEYMRALSQLEAVRGCIVIVDRVMDDGYSVGD